MDEVRRLVVASGITLEAARFTGVPGVGLPKQEGHSVHGDGGFGFVASIEVVARAVVDVLAVVGEVDQH